MLYLIVPVYNTAQYLEECLDSVFSQGISDMTVVAVDDGSTDDSLEILRSYQKKYSGLLVFHTTNRGPSAARNLALDSLTLSEDDLITFLDSDDVFAHEYLSQMIGKIEETNADIVCSSFSYYDGSNFHPATLYGSQERILSGFEATRELLTDRSIQSHSHCKMYKAALWNGVRYPEHVVAMEDQATIYKTFCKSRRVCVFPSCGYLYRRRADSICKAAVTNKRVLDSIEGYLLPCLDPFLYFSKNEAKELRAAAKQALGATLLMMIPRWDAKKATKTETARKKFIFAKVRKIHPVLSFKPHNAKERMKKALFLFARPVYRPLYLSHIRSFSN